MTTYARTTVLGGVHKRWVYLHHLVNGYPLSGLETDHRDRDGLNNRRENLRVATVPQNRQNTARRNPSKLGRGVRKHGRKFVARVGDVTVGGFATPEEASAAYDTAAIRIYGPDALMTGHRDPSSLRGLKPVKLDKVCPSPSPASREVPS